jgi:acetyl esterase/lipase
MLLRYAIASLLLCVTVAAHAEEKVAPKIQPDVVYGHKDGLAMTFDVHRPEKEANGAAVLFMVSGGWYSVWGPPEQLRPMFATVLDRGYTVLAVRHGSSPRYTIPEAVADVRRAVRYVRLNAEELGIDPNRLGVMGMSAGGHLSLMLGTTGDDGDAKAADPVDRESSRVQAVVALVPPTDLRVAVWEAPESLPAYRNFPALD